MEATDINRHDPKKFYSIGPLGVGRNEGRTVGCQIMTASSEDLSPLASQSVFEEKKFQILADMKLKGVPRHSAGRHSAKWHSAG